ncbi:MAG: hypothetical protein J5J06_01235 [Phycisphaerae bacterium]|nr:hypothetical protein [Phycisphaerae bacterium]
MPLEAMSVISTVSRLFSRSLTWRVFWGAMILAHAEALVSVWRGLIESGPTTSTIGGCVAVSLSVLFFAIKLSHPDWLHIRGDRRGWVAVFLVLSLIHAHCLPTSADAPPEMTAFAVLTASAVGGTLLVLELAKRSSKGRRGLDVPSSLLAPCVDWVRNRLLDDRPTCRVLALHAFSLRAPPSC